MKRIKIILCLASCVLCLKAQIYLSPYEPVYEDLRYLQTGGLLPRIDLNQIPVIQGELVEAIGADLKLGAYSSTQCGLMNRIRTSYAIGHTVQSVGLLNRLLERILINRVKEPQFYVGMRTDLTAVSDPGRLYPELKTFGAVLLPYGISVVNVMAIDPYVADPPESRACKPDYIGHKWRGFSGYTEQAYFLWQTKYSRLTLGRSYAITGPGRNGHLMFSGAARPLDQIRLEYFNKRFSFQTLMAQLDIMADANRYLVSHRFTFFLKRWQISLTETILYGKSGQGIEWAYLNPFLFYHGEQLNGPGLGGNTLGSLELTYTGNRWSAYTEILIDDVQIDKAAPSDLEPNEIGVVAGFDLADPFSVEGLYVCVEYTALTNRTYKTASPYEFYLHRNVPLGYPLGSDLDRWDLIVKKYLCNWQAIIRFDYLRRGSGEMNVPWDMPWMNCTLEEGYNEPFPTGIVEKTADLGLEIRWLPWYNRYVILKINLQDIHNVAHTRNNERNVIVTLGLHWNLKLEI